MKERSVSRRNFTGALLGGMLGILALGYLHQIALPFGCFFGVVIGWWYQEIWQSITNSYRRSVARTCKVWRCCVTFVCTPTQRLRKFSFNIGPVLKVLHFFLFIFAWLFRWPITLIKWLRAHPINQAYMVRALAITTNLALNALWLVPFVIYFTKAIESAGEESAMPIVYLLCLICVPMIVLSAAFLLLEERGSEQRKFFFIWERYINNGPFLFFIKDLGKSFLYQAYMLLFVGGVFAWFILVGGAFLALMIIPASVAIGAVKAIYNVSIKAGHWLCFGATVTVTGLVAWMTYPYLNDPRVLWSIALLSGLASAGVTEALRRSLVWFFSKNSHAWRIASETLGAQLAPSGRAFRRINRNAMDWASNALPATF